MERPIDLTLTDEGLTPTPRAFVLFGVTERDPNERVFQVFATTTDLSEFEADLPGSYDRGILWGVSYDDIDIEVVS